MTNVSEDNDLAPAEKQVSLTTTKAADHFRIHSEVTTITRYLLEHPAVEIVERRTQEGDVVAVTANVPRGLVDLKGKPRKSNQFSGIVSSAQLREVETDD